jgi:hypothetical protein
MEAKELTLEANIVKLARERNHSILSISASSQEKRKCPRGFYVNMWLLMYYITEFLNLLPWG